MTGMKKVNQNMLINTFDPKAIYILYKGVFVECCLFTKFSVKITKIYKILLVYLLHLRGSMKLNHIKSN